MCQRLAALLLKDELDQKLVSSLAVDIRTVVQARRSGTKYVAVSSSGTR